MCRERGDDEVARYEGGGIGCQGGRVMMMRVNVRVGPCYKNPYDETKDYFCQGNERPEEEEEEVVNQTQVNTRAFISLSLFQIPIISINPLILSSNNGIHAERVNPFTHLLAIFLSASSTTTTLLPPPLNSPSLAENPILHPIHN